MKKILAILAVLALSTTAFAQLPKVQLKDLKGKVVSADTLRNDGKPFVISFFATWCKPCNRELSAIAEVYDEWQEETGMKVIAISIDQAQQVSKVKPLVDSNEWEYDILLDTNSDLLRALGIQMIPHVLILDGNGKIIESRSGYTEGSEGHIIEKVREILTSKPADGKATDDAKTAEAAKAADVKAVADAPVSDEPKAEETPAAE